MIDQTNSPFAVPTVAALDYSTFALKWVGDAVGATHPIRFGLVLLGALGIQGIATVLFDAVSSLAWVNTIATLPVYQMVGITFTIFFIPLLWSRHRIPEDTLSELALIDKLIKRSGLSRSERRLVYLEILEGSFEKGHRFSIVDIGAIKRIRETELVAKIEKVKNSAVP
jgi:hypothetical protein